MHPKLSEIIICAGAGCYPPRQFKDIGHLTNKERFPEVVNTKSEDLQQWPEHFSPKRTTMRKRFIKGADLSS
jgi:hypothetical protein